MPSIQKRTGLAQLGQLNPARYQEDTPVDDDLAKLKRGPVESAENDHDDIEGLTGHLVVYLHDEIPALFDYSRSALVGLDSYFESNPLSTSFKRPFVERELIPAIGAYFGEVLVQQLGGRWLKREPIGLTAVAVRGYVIIPSRVAVDVASSGLSLAQVFDANQAEDR